MIPSGKEGITAFFRFFQVPSDNSKPIIVFSKMASSTPKQQIKGTTMHQKNNCPFSETGRTLKKNPPRPQTTLQYYVNYYKQHLGPNLDASLQMFRSIGFIDAVKYAGLLACPVCDATHPHQRRTPTSARPQFSSQLVAVATSLKGSVDFEDLFQKVEAVGNQIKGIGDLAIYDAALRISANLGILPQKKVYLYQGARIKGLKKGPNDIGLFNSTCQALGAYYLEDFLCIFHDKREKGLFDVLK